MEKKPHAGHRQRMLEKMRQGVLKEHEYLEILLFNALPRRDTNDLAHRLISRFGSLTKIFAAPLEELCKVDGVGESVAAYLLCVGEIYRYYYSQEQPAYDGRFDHARFVEYLATEYIPKPIEVLEIYLVDELGYIFGRKDFYGDINSAHLESLEFSKLLTKNAPKGIILVHNHPRGTPTPSDTDEDMTKLCQVICNAHGVMLLEHAIYSSGGVYSYYAAGKIQEYSYVLSIDNLLHLAR